MLNTTVIWSIGSLIYFRNTVMFKKGNGRCLNLRLTKVWWIIGGIAMVNLFLYWHIRNSYTVNKGNNIPVSTPKFSDYRDRYTGGWSPYRDVLSEEEVLNSPQITDPKQAFKNLTVNLKGGTVNYLIGDNIYLDIKAYDYYEDIRPFGGDHIRIRMAEGTANASSSGYVLDHGNGSYTGVLKAFWNGMPTIFVEMVYTREEIAFIYELRRKFPKLRGFQAIYKDNIMQETGDCLPNMDGLNANHGICNLTDRNHGIPWFCERPVTHDLTCENVTMITNVYIKKKILMTDLHSKLWEKKERKEIELQIFVKGKRLQKQHFPASPKYERQKLWKQRSPVGFYYNGRWQFSHCKAAPKTDYPDCLSHKALLLYGDSTVAQWYNELKQRFHCINVETFKARQGCMTRDLDLSIYSVPHNLPGNTENINSRWSLEELLDSIAEQTKPVVLVHLYAHYTALNINIYRERLQKLRKSIEYMLNKRPDALFLFKGPHTFHRKFRVVTDYFAYVFRPIIIEELEGLHDKIVYLDYVDMSIAKAVKELHPAASFVNDMLDVMIAYVC